VTAELTNPAAVLAASPAPQAAGNTLALGGPAALAGASPARDGAGQAEPREFSRFINDLKKTVAPPAVTAVTSPDGDRALPSDTGFSQLSPPLVLPDGRALPISELQSTHGRPLPAPQAPGSELPEGGNALPPTDLAQLPPELLFSSATAPMLQATTDGASGAPPASMPPPLPGADVAGRILATQSEPALAEAKGAPDASTTQRTSPNIALAEFDTGGALNDGQDAPEHQFADHASRLMDKLGTMRESLQQGNSLQTPRFTLQADAAVTGTVGGTSSFAADRAEPMYDLRQFVAQQPLQPAADSNRFAAGLGERLMFMSQNGVQSAQLKLHPEYLGPLDVRIQIEDDVAQVWFGAQHGQTREALEAALPRLREMFAEQGIQLAHADVESQQQHDRSSGDGAGRPDRASDPSVAGHPSAEPELMTLVAIRSPDRLVDVYA
jgi:flagellar hook-length control protein FliK